ncbi:Hypothetical_protein [Hexamita inflata]|uniref:Hypothetical_protein n=1 Tax=Hexamita inflata TaxID=28002 RepID=A0AA86NAY8_9EUKA|nr:Hypothetical protein HINF_LOCUS4032 [Hexamita inflata]
MRVYIICSTEIHQSLVYLTYLTILLINKSRPEIRSAGDADFPIFLRVFSKIRVQEGSGPDFRQENESPNLESRVSPCLQQENSENGIDQFILARKYFQAESNVRRSR